ncbi:THY1 Predicted alternative thymidylate synthase [uncultured Caudovirales phage]|uniref:THY1 Predicted alternative thymidylate synthase n=1 Tax=uncultured Caudovirales phage TaxID=2100421 RepID=A0A6J5LXE6_9CAUD|nr:THY1 Predicted alternative thymidylate synthase [uncultured Caudovirales phage]
MKATYIDHMGSDLTVVNAARVSFAKHHQEFKPLADTNLIAYLARHNHWTPFAHPQITLHMKAPIFVRTQCFKHKVGFTENEVSRRYIDSQPEFYIPAEWRKRASDKKQGSSSEIAMIEAQVGFEGFCGEAVAFYNDLIDSGVAPEQARMVLPQAMYTEWYWTGSLAAWARFVKQRTHTDAQLEIAELAKQCGKIIAPLFPVSWKALVG